MEEAKFTNLVEELLENLKSLVNTLFIPEVAVEVLVEEVI